MAEGDYGTRRRQITLMIVSVALVPLLLMTGSLLFEFYRSHQEKVTAHLAELVLKHKQNIDGFLRAKLGEIRVLARSYSFDQLREEEFLLERLAILHQEFDPVIVDLGVINSEGRQVAYAGPFRLGEADYHDAEWFQEAMRREYTISDVFPGLRALPHFIVAVRTTVDERTWILRATVDFAAFNELVKNVRIGETGFAFIINRRGDFQTKAAREVETDGSRYLDMLVDSDTYGSEVRVVETRNGLEGDVIYVATDLKDQDWVLICQQDASDAFSDFHKALRTTVVIVLLGVLFVVTTAFIIARAMVSRLERVEEEKQIMNRQVVETGRLASLGELAAGIAHEINNPVAIMVEEAGWIGDLLEEEDLKQAENLPEFQRALTQIRTQGKRCKEITHKLLSFARKTDSRIQEVCLYDLIEEMVDLSAQRARYSNVEIKTACEPDLPTIHVSLSEMQQVLLNLINNALDAMEKTGGSLTLDVHLDEDDGDHVVLLVTDTGPGIPQAIIDRVFDPFFTTKPVGKGTGLGLSICYGIVKKMNGEISARSVVGSGTTFRIRLPVGEKQPDPWAEARGAARPDEQRRDSAREDRS